MSDKLPPPARAYKVITCILPAGRGQELLTRLRKEKDVVNASVHHARGVGSDTLRRRRAYYFTEKDVVVALAEAEHADELFEFMYFAAGIDQPHAGMLFMERAFRGAGMVPPDVPDEA